MGLVRYPTTVAPETGSVIVETYCADNAHSISDMSVQCHHSGIWHKITSYSAVPPLTPRCQCDTGYHNATVNGRMICQGTNTIKLFALGYILSMHS